MRKVGCHCDRRTIWASVSHCWRQGWRPRASPGSQRSMCPLKRAPMQAPTDPATWVVPYSLYSLVPPRHYLPHKLLILLAQKVGQGRGGRRRSCAWVEGAGHDKARCFTLCWRSNTKCCRVLTSVSSPFPSSSSPLPLNILPNESSIVLEPSPSSFTPS